jgi:trk system potassium uptake protein TrkA
MLVIVAGGGRTGAQLAKSLVGMGHDVHVVENRNEILARIHKELPTESIFEGDPLDAAVMESAGIKEADVFAATTTSDSANLALCYYIRERYKINRTIARVNNPRNAWLFNQMFHVDVSVNQAELLSRLIEEEMSLGDMMTLLKLRRGKYSLVEEKIPPKAKAIGAAIKDLPLPENCVIAAIIRQGELVLPRGITVLEVGDEVLAITDEDGTSQLAELFYAKREKD